MNIGTQDGRVFESVSFTTIRNHITVLLLYMLTAGNFAILNSTISQDRMIAFVVIISILCLGMLVANYILFATTKSEFLVSIFLMLTGISVYIALAILYFNKAGVTLLLAFILIMTLYYSLHFNLGMLIISVIHIGFNLYYVLVIGPQTVDIAYGHYIAVITTALLSIYYTIINNRLYAKYMLRMNAHITELTTQNVKLEHLNEELRVAKGTLNEQYRETKELNKKNAALSAKFSSLVDLSTEGIIDFDIAEHELTLSEVAVKLLNVTDSKFSDWSKIAHHMTERSMALFSTSWNNLLEGNSKRETLIIDYMSGNKVINLKFYFSAYTTDESNDRYIVGTIQDVTDELSASHKISHLAYHDFITNLPNRSHFIELVREDFKSCDGKVCAMVCINLDDFKSFNRAHGYDNGNRMLNHVSEALVNTFESSRISRIYSNTFALLIADSQELEETIIYIQKILAHLAMLHFNIQSFTATIGATQFTPATDLTIESILLDAEKNIYVVREETGEGGHYKITEQS